MACLDISSLIKEQSIGVGISYGFSGKWSAEGHAQTMISFPSSPSEEAMDHEGEFSDEAGHKAGESSIYRICAGVRYWPSGRFERAFIGTGIMMNGNGQKDMTVSVGYILDIWKGLAATAAAELDMIRTWKEHSPRGRGITIGICLKF